jgi:hypothetical protein
VSTTSTGRGELSVLVACHSFLVAIPARSVARLLVHDDVGPLARSAGTGPMLGTLRVGDRTCAAWDLGGLLEMPPLSRAWVVVDVALGAARVAIALRTGVCALVAEVRPEASLPPRIFRTRAHAFPAAFAASPIAAGVPALFGLWLDPARLFTDEELARSSAAIAHAHEESVKR